MTRLRRRLHRTPELAHEEWHTAEILEMELRQLGLSPFRPAPTSLAVVVGPTDRPPDVGFRADLDALPIQEETGASYASEIDGKMHACGHDGHAAALVGLAQALCLEPLDRSALLVFQQAEESYPSGAPMVLVGLAGVPIPPEFFAFHVWPQLDVGSVGVREGAMLGAVAGLTVRITGEAGRTHGTNVGTGGVDALAAGAGLYLDILNEFGSGRGLRDDRPSSLSIGKLHAGSAPNALPLECTLEGTLRAVSWAAQESALRRLASVANGVADATGATITIDVLSGVRPPVVNDPASVIRIQQACRQAGIACIDYPDEPAAVSDDFGWFIDGSPGALVFVGCGSEFHRADLHTPMFDFDEAALIHIVEIAIELTRSS